MQIKPDGNKLTFSLYVGKAHCFLTYDIVSGALVSSDPLIGVGSEPRPLNAGNPQQYLLRKIENFDYEPAGEKIYYMERNKQPGIGLADSKLKRVNLDPWNVIIDNIDINYPKTFVDASVRRAKNGKMYVSWFSFNHSLSNPDSRSLVSYSGDLTGSPSGLVKSYLNLNAGILLSGLPLQPFMKKTVEFIASNSQRLVGEKAYEVTDHLGNVRAVFSDKRVATVSGGTTITGFNLDVKSWTDYYSFGMVMPGRSYNSLDYRYGFNGKEKDDEVKRISGSSYDFGARMYDSRIGRFQSVDPDFRSFPYYSPYITSSNSPISHIDIDGRFSIELHYDITYNAALKLGYSKEMADKIAFFSSTYADHPSPDTFYMMGGLINNNVALSYGRFGVNYIGGIADATKFSQIDMSKYVTWHSMLTTWEKRAGYTEEFAKKRGMDFGWKSVIEGATNNNIALFSQGLHALQDADAHDGASMDEHLDFAKNPFQAAYMCLHDCLGSTLEAERYTRTSLMLFALLGDDQESKEKIINDNSYNGKLYIPTFGVSNENMDMMKEALIKKGYKNVVLNSSTYRIEF